MLEPTRRDSAAAVAVAAAVAARRSPQTIVVVLAADHVVRDRQGLVELCKKAASSSHGAARTIGCAGSASPAMCICSTAISAISRACCASCRR
ncbi:sugar phosphate nucleotidyltransferase [Methylocystis sp. JR02]|uniref:sugar phosphate nucleotidyltransferase n=1 Tax=Methylocystis sp. JR02 TaxID=3046284 RepID=UPI0024BB4E0D|nr:sugar phosphate nucleotidyltransferase [Methylocystis sp. JR02]MDJ0447116.1 sugar phosphate nucleotidyltransferase [Methylocystis sp. JR02]